MQEINAACAGLELDAYLIEAKLPRGTSAGFRLKAGAGEHTVAGINAQTEEVYVDRSASGKTDFHSLFAGVHAAKLAAPAEVYDLTIYVDRSSVEVFAGGGQAVITELIFPGPASAGLAAFAEQEEQVFLSLELYELASSAAAGGRK